MKKSKEEIVMRINGILKERINDLEELRGKGVLSDEHIDYLIDNYKERIEDGKKLLGD